MLEDLRLTNEYKAIKLFNYKSDNFSESIEQCRDSFIVVDNADNLKMIYIPYFQRII